jgi:hypothetical protein
MGNKIKTGGVSTKQTTQEKNLLDNSQIFVNSNTFVPPDFFKVQSLTNGALIFADSLTKNLAICDIKNSSVQVIISDHLKFKANVDFKSNDGVIFIICHKIRNGPILEIQQYSLEETDENNPKFDSEWIETLRSMFNSISFHQAIFKQKLDVEGESMRIIEQINSNLLFYCGDKLIHLDLEKNEIVKEFKIYFQNYLSQIQKTKNYIYMSQLGYQQIGKDWIVSDSIRGISPDEMFIATFDKTKSEVSVFLLNDYEKNPKDSSIASFKTLGFVRNILFSADSEFIYMVEEMETEKCFLLIFSMREKKLMFKRKLKENQTSKIILQNNLVLVSSIFSYSLAEVLEIKIPIRLKPYSFQFPTDISFYFVE